MRKLYMPGFLKTVSSLRQNFFACLSAIADKGAGIIPWGVGRVTESGFLLSESACFLCRTALERHALQACPVVD